MLYDLRFPGVAKLNQWSEKQRERHRGVASLRAGIDVSESLIKWTSTPKTKTAFVFFWHDEFSFFVMIDLLHRGYKVLCCQRDHPGPAVGPRLNQEMEEEVTKVLQPCGLILVPFDVNDLSSLKSECLKHTDKLDLVCLMNPVPPHIDPLKAFGGFAGMSDVKLWNAFCDFTFVLPTATLSALHSLVCKVGCWLFVRLFVF